MHRIYDLRMLLPLCSPHLQQRSACAKPGFACTTALHTQRLARHNPSLFAFPVLSWALNYTWGDVGGKKQQEQKEAFCSLS